MRTTRILVAALGVATLGCFGQSGIEPPVDRIFLPSTVLTSGDGRWLYVVNSNADLRYNAGTVAAFDLNLVAADRQGFETPCASNDFLPTGKPSRFCCRDVFDHRIRNCDERAYVQGDNTIGIGSFGSGIVAQSFVRSGVPVERLFVSVRGDPSITFVDAAQTPSGPKFSCNGTLENPRPSGRGALCGDAFKIESAMLSAVGEPPTKTLLPQEPFSLALDQGRSLLFVGHTTGGVSLVDVCAPETMRLPQLLSVNEFVFADRGRHGVTGVVVTDTVGRNSPVYSISSSATVIGENYLSRPSQAGCAGVPNLHLVSSRGLQVAAFLPRDSDMRGLLIQPDESRAFLLHRTTDNPGSGFPTASAVTRLSILQNAVGEREFVATATVEVGAGPMEMRMHDAGRGQKLFVPCFESGQVYVVDPETTKLDSIIDIGRGPSSIAFSPTDPRIAFVAGFADNNVSVIDLDPKSANEYRVVQRIGFPRAATRNPK